MGGCYIKIYYIRLTDMTVIFAENIVADGSAQKLFNNDNRKFHYMPNI